MLMYKWSSGRLNKANNHTLHAHAHTQCVKKEMEFPSDSNAELQLRLIFRHFEYGKMMRLALTPHENSRFHSDEDL